MGINIYTINIPPRIRKLHNQILYTLSLKYLLFLYLSVFFLEIRKICPNKFVGYTRIKIISKASFFSIILTPHSVLTFCLTRNLLFVYPLTTEIFFLFTQLLHYCTVILPMYRVKNTFCLPSKNHFYLPPCITSCLF